MAGNKNSGRRGYRHEIQAKEALELSFSTVVKCLKDESLPLELRLKAAIPLTAKYFPEKIDFNDVNALTFEQKCEIATMMRELLSRRPVPLLHVNPA